VLKKRASVVRPSNAELVEDVQEGVATEEREVAPGSGKMVKISGKVGFETVLERASPASALLFG
jgi:hypothetical protein